MPSVLADRFEASTIRRAVLPCRPPGGPPPCPRSLPVREDVHPESLLLRPVARDAARLGGYRAADGDPARVVISVPRSDGSFLVIDCAAESLADARLVGLIGSDEPRENPRVLAELYLADETRGSCRALSTMDLLPETTSPPTPASEVPPPPAVESGASTYRIRVIAAGHAFPELRWTVATAANPEDRFDLLTLRDVIGRLEAYEPPRAMTENAILFGNAEGVSSVKLRCELDRVLSSSIVLNRGLREAVERAVACGVTMSEVAIRCGRIKRDSRGKTSGETSWLARRVGVLPEGGQLEPTPWVHSNTLALIARRGLGVNPNEVEL